MKTSWPVKMLGDVCDIIGGGTPSKANAAFYFGTIPWATVRDMGNATLDKTEFCITQEAVSSSATNIIPKGNVIIASRVGLGKACILKNDTAINQDLRAIIPKEENLSRRYLFWWFSSIADYIVSQGNGATVRGVTLPFLKSLQIPLPPLSEQERIVGILDAAFEKIDAVQRNAERNLANAEELFQRVLDEEMTPKGDWTSKKLEELGTFKNGLNYRQVNQGILCPIVGVKDFSTPVLSSTEFLSRVCLTHFPAEDNLLKRGDIVFVRSNGSKNLVGRSVLIAFDNFKASFSGFCIRYRLFESSINAAFCQLFIGRSKYIKQMLKDKDSCNINNVNQTILSSQVISFPPVEQQRNIVQRIGRIQVDCVQIELHCSNVISQCLELKKQILAKAFNGEL